MCYTFTIVKPFEKIEDKIGDLNPIFNSFQTPKEKLEQPTHGGTYANIEGLKANM